MPGACSLSMPQAATRGSWSWRVCRCWAMSLRGLAPQVSRLVLNANGDPARFASFGLDVVADAVADQGPLAGLLAAMHWAEAEGARHFRHRQRIGRHALPSPRSGRASAHAGPAKPAIAASGGRIHPVIGHWPLTLRPSLERALKEERRSMQGFALDHGAIAVAFASGTIAGRTVDPFFNANTPDELAHARALLTAPAPGRHQNG